MTHASLLHNAPSHKVYHEYCVVAKGKKLQIVSEENLKLPTLMAAIVPHYSYFSAFYDLENYRIHLQQRIYTAQDML